MKLDFDNCCITIDDNSEEAKKIKQGYDYFFIKGKLKIGNMGTKINNKYQVIKAINNAKNLEQLKVALTKNLEL